MTGTIFSDTSGNGRLDAGETGLAGRRVFADYNFNAMFDAGEAFAVTGVNGTYQLATRPDQVSVRLELLAGEAVSLPYGATSLWLATVSGTIAGKHIGVVTN